MIAMARRRLRWFGAGLMHPRFLTLFALPNLIFVLMEMTLGTGRLITLFNAAMIGLSAAVAIAYLPRVLEVLFTDKPIGGAGWLSLGIEMSWLGSLDLRIGSVVWRMAGRPNEWEINSSISYGLFLYLCAGVCHLAAKGAMDDGQIPPGRWIRIGALIGASISTLILLGYAVEWLGLLPSPRS